jgi:hypothetical protein
VTRTRILRYIGMLLIEIGLTLFTFKSYAWVAERSWTVLVLPISYLVNAISIEILFSRHERRELELRRLVEDYKKGTDLTES